MCRVRINLNLGLSWCHLCTEVEKSVIRAESSKQEGDRVTKEVETDLVLV